MLPSSNTLMVVAREDADSQTVRVPASTVAPPRTTAVTASKFIAARGARKISIAPTNFAIPVARGQTRKRTSSLLAPCSSITMRMRVVFNLFEKGNPRSWGSG